MLNVKLIINNVKQPSFREIPKISYDRDPFDVLSMIPPNILMIQDARCFYTYKSWSIGNMEIRKLYNQFFDNGVLREANTIVERKWLRHALYFSNIFKTEWIKIVLSRIHDKFIWLENGPIKIILKVSLIEW